MANSPDMKEGFLCPVCKIDLRSMVKLHSHFHEEHSEDKELTRFFKGVLGQAKKIITQSSDSDETIKLAWKRETLFSLDIYDNPQPTGAATNHTEMFQTMRNKRLEGFAAETNKLIIRLDKLLLNMPSDPARRKMHEQTVVPWLEGDDVPRCPECTRLFHLARRKHHCRLCGSIMCDDCSRFLSISKAKIILSCSAGDPTEEEANPDSDLRICQYCISLLESRESMKAARECNPVINQYYEKLIQYVKKLEKDSELFEKMSLSLNEGKSMYNLNDAQDLWEKIMRTTETVGVLCGQLANLGISDSSTTDKQLKLQKSISLGVNGYIQSKILALPTLPSEDIYRSLQESRRKNVEREIKEQKQEELTEALLGSQIRTEVIHYPKRQLEKNPTKEVDSTAWMPVTLNTVYNDDPMILQMNNLRNYIKQAREAYKYDEVASLENNLRELQEEYFRLRQTE